MRECLPEAMGMSWELADAHVEDMRAEVWTLTRATFTGAAILLREKAAYRNTSFELAATKLPVHHRPPGAAGARARGHNQTFSGGSRRGPPGKRSRKGRTHGDHRQAKTWSR